MFKEFFQNELTRAINKSIKTETLGMMKEYSGGLIIEKPKNSDFGDFAVNVSPLAKVARLAPPIIASAIAEHLDKTQYEVNIIGGFINFKLNKSILKKVISEIITQGETYGKPTRIIPEKIILEYVSANPTGPFHIGHGRWAAMGSALANLLKFYGHEVYQEFYINDAGSQIQKLGKSLAIRIRQEFGEKIEFPTDEIEKKNYYCGEYLIPVAKKFITEHTDAKSLIDNTELLSDYAKQEMERLQKNLLKSFRTEFDKFYSELELHNSGKVEASYLRLKESGDLYEKDGAMWFKSSIYGDDQDRVIKKADGSNTYLTADIAYHADKLNRGFDRMINIWGADHHGYIARVKASLQALGYNPEKLEILLGQLVNLIINGEEVRMGKRRNMVTLEDLIEEVGIDATRFWMCMRNADVTLDFDIELAKQSTDENPVFYVQYAYARACSILRNAVTERIDIESGKKLPSYLTVDELETITKCFDNTSEPETDDSTKKLILKLDEFGSVISGSVKNRTVYTICRYAQELASDFHSFYNSNRVLSEDTETTKFRTSLVYCVKTVLKTSLDILAVTAPEKM